MKYYLLLRSRPRPDEPVPAAHDRVMSELSTLPSPWGLVSKPWPKAKEPGGEFVEPVLLRGAFGKTIVLMATYCNRRVLKDEGSADDVFAFDFNAKKVDYPQLLDSALPRYIEITRAYRAQLMPYDYLLQEASNMRPIDQRFGVYGICPVNYFDSELSRRAFGLSPQQLLERLQGKVAHERMLGDGAYIIATREIVDAEQARQLDGQVKPLLLASNVA
jgi:hypothetical protein